MYFDPAWPANLRDFLLDRYGPPQSIEPLLGQSQNRVWAIRFANDTKVVKATRALWEACFYERVATAWEYLWFRVPKMDWSLHEGDLHWLVLEWIPEPLPRHRWLADPEILETLAGLHAGWKDLPPIPGAHLSWERDDSEALVELMPAPDRPFFAKELEALRRRADFQLFSRDDVTSGDPNPTNWGLRSDGSLVLYDWERFGLNSGSIDLAITTPGLGSRADYELIAARYAMRSDENPKELAREIALAKVWTVVEFVHERSQHRLSPPLSDSLRRKIAPWLREIIEGGWARASRPPWVFPG